MSSLFKTRTFLTHFSFLSVRYVNQNKCMMWWNEKCWKTKKKLNKNNTRVGITIISWNICKERKKIVNQMWVVTPYYFFLSSVSKCFVFVPNFYYIWKFSVMFTNFKTLIWAEPNIVFIILWHPSNYNDVYGSLPSPKLRKFSHFH